MYHHGNLREAALDEAVVMLETVGADALTLRSLAERLGVTHRALYRHFDDRVSLLSEAAVRTIQALQATMAEAASGAGASKRGKLTAVTDAYLRFALEKPEAYRHATHAGFAKNSASAELHKAGRSLGTFFSSLFAPGEVIRDDAIAALRHAWP